MWGAFGAEASASWSTGGGGGGGGSSEPSAVPTQLEYETARWAPLVVYLREHNDKTLKSGSVDDLSKAVRAAMIAMSYMGANPANLPTPIRSVTDVALYERFAQYAGTAWMQEPIRQFDEKLYARLMGVAAEVAQMKPIATSGQIITRMPVKPGLVQQVTTGVTAAGKPAHQVIWHEGGMMPGAPPPPTPIPVSTTPPEMLGPGGIPWMWIGLGALALGVGGFVLWRGGK